MNESEIILQALTDGFGYPKSDAQQKKIGFSEEYILTLLNVLEDDPGWEFNQEEKQLIVNCLAGAVDYVGSDISVLYSCSRDELQSFREELQMRWRVASGY